MDVFLYEVFEEEAELFRQYVGKRFSYEATSKTIQEACHKEPPARLISIRTQSHIPPEWAASLSGVLSRSTGYDHLVAFKQETGVGVPCGYLDEYATRAVAEHAALLVLALFRRLTAQITKFQSFNRDEITGMECKGRNLLVVGVGRIGTEILEIGRGLGMTVRGVDIVRDKRGIEYVSPEEGISWADVIVCSMNLTEGNRRYFSYEILSRSRAGVIFVNIARGELSPLKDLLRLLKEGRLGGVGLDVFEDEGNLALALRSGQASETDFVGVVREMLKYPNVIMTPHNAFNTMEAIERKTRMSIDQILHFLKHRDFEWKL
jgi:D-lactate dehydrogenase